MKLKIAFLFFSRGESEVDILDQLSDNQRNRLNLSLLQVANRQIISHKQLKSEVAQWLNE